MKTRIRLLVLAVAAFVVGGGAAVLLVPGLADRLASIGTEGTGRALVGGPFSLIDHTGRPRTERDFAGGPMLVFFGFTNCPDICPSGLQVMTQAMERIGTAADRITPIFISVDHERDTPEQLALYVQSFHPRLVGLTGSAEAIQQAAKAYRVYFRKVKDDSNTSGYTVDHTSIIYLMDGKGQFYTHFTHAASVEAMAAALAKVR